MFDDLRRHYVNLAQPRLGADMSPHVVVSDELLDYVRSEPDLTLLAYSTLLSGGYTRPDRLSSRYEHPGTTARLAALREVAAELGATPNQVVLAWLMRGDPPIVPVLGVSSVAQLDECLDAVDVPLDAELWDRLAAAG